MESLRRLTIRRAALISAVDDADEQVARSGDEERLVAQDSLSDRHRELLQWVSQPSDDHSPTTARRPMRWLPALRAAQLPSLNMAMGSYDTRGRIALVTGANKGIGRAIAQRLGQLRMTVYVGARDAERGTRAAAELAADGDDARFVQLDVTDARSIERAARLIESAAGRLDILVNNAGIVTDPRLAPSATPVEHVRLTYETNVFGVIAVTNAMLGLLRRSDAARIVNLGSDLGSLHHAVAGDHPVGAFPPLLAYNSSKTALNAITIAYANELRDAGILVNTVSPGSVATDQNDHQGELTPEQGARLPVVMATLAPGGPTGTYRTQDGSPQGRIVPW